jgi:hypothetical protein
MSIANGPIATTAPNTRIKLAGTTGFMWPLSASFIAPKFFQKQPGRVGNLLPTIKLWRKSRPPAVSLARRINAFGNQGMQRL